MGEPLCSHLREVRRVSFGNAYLCDGNRIDEVTEGNHIWLIEARMSIERILLCSARHYLGGIRRIAQRRSNAITNRRNKTIGNRECSVVAVRSSGSVTDRRNKTIENRECSAVADRSSGSVTDRRNKTIENRK